MEQSVFVLEQPKLVKQEIFNKFLTKKNFSFARTGNVLKLEISLQATLLH